MLLTFFGSTPFELSRTAGSPAGKRWEMRGCASFSDHAVPREILPDRDGRHSTQVVAEHWFLDALER